MSRYQPDPASTPAPEIPTDTPKGKAGLVSIAVMCSRILGLIRDVILAGLFGGSRAMDAFVVAYRAPNMLRDLFAEGALSTAFVTTLSKTLKSEGEAEAWSLARKMLTLVSVFMAALSVAGILIVPWFIRLMAYGWNDDPGKIELTAHLAQVMYPFIALISLAALVMGMLNARGVFFIPAISSSFFNLGSIIAGTTAGYLLDPTWGEKAMTGIAIGVLVGGTLQLAIQLPALRKVGFRFHPDFGWKDPGVRRVLSLMGPAIIAGSAVQAGVLLNTFFASYLEGDGLVSYLQWSFRLIQLPIGVFGVAVATVTLPAVSRAATEGIGEEFRNILARGIRLVLLLTFPCAIGLAILAEPIISIIYQRWNFSLEDLAGTSASLRCYALGLVFYAGVKVISPTFYAIERKWIPMLVSLLSIAEMAGLNYVWVFVLNKGVAFLALSTAIGSFVNFTILYLLMQKYANGLQTAQLVSSFIRLAIAGGLLAAVTLIAQHTILANWQDLQFALKIVYLGVTIGLAAAFYFAAAKLLRIEEMDEFLAIVRRRTGR